MLITTDELATRARKTKRWIQQLCKDGTIKAEKIGRDYLIKQPDAEEWLASLPGDKEKPDKE